MRIKFISPLFIVVLLSACTGASSTEIPVINSIPSETHIAETSATPPPLPTFTLTNTTLPATQIISEFPFAPLLNEALPKDGLVLAAHIFADTVAHIDTDNVCYDVGIYNDDTYIVITCLVDITYPAPNGTLDANESSHLQRWVERFVSYEEPSQHLFVKFIGNGTSMPDITEKIAMENLVSALEYRAHAYTSGGGIPNVIYAAQSALSLQFGIAPDAIILLKFESMDFPDACLGAPKLNEVCAQIITQGLRVLLIGNGLMYEYHTDFAGYDIRLFGEPQIAPTQGAGG